MAATNPQMVGARDLISLKILPSRRRVASIEEAQYRLVGLGAIGNQQVGVLGRADKSVRDHGEAANHDVVEADGVGLSNDAV